MSGILRALGLSDGRQMNPTVVFYKTTAADSYRLMGKTVQLPPFCPLAPNGVGPGLLASTDKPSAVPWVCLAGLFQTSPCPVFSL